MFERENGNIDDDGEIGDVGIGDVGIGDVGAIEESGVDSEAFELSWQFRTCSNNCSNPGP